VKQDFASQSDFRGGMVSYLSPEQIGDSAYAHGLNGEIRSGRFETRRGATACSTFAGRNGSYRGSGVFNFDGDVPGYVAQALAFSVGNYAEATGSVFNDTYIATRNNLELLDPAAHSANLITIRNAVAGEGFNIRERHRFVQCDTKLFILRQLASVNLNPLVCDDVYWTNEFTDTTCSRKLAAWAKPASYIATPGYLPFPKAFIGLYAYGRLWLAEGNTLCASDILQPDKFSQANSFSIDGGQGADITALHMLGSGAIAVFKRNSIHILSGCESAILSTGMSRQVLESAAGAVADEAVCQVGNDVWYIAPDGIRSLALNEQNHWRGSSSALSYPIAPSLLARWDRRQLHLASIAVADDYVLAAAPGVDGDWPVFAYDLTTQSWAGEWNTQAPLFRLMALDMGQGHSFQSLSGPTGTAAGIVRLLDGLMADETPTVSGVFSAPIESTLLTRGYSSNGGYAKSNPLAAEIRIRHRSPSLSIDLHVDGGRRISVLVAGKSYGIAANDYHGKTGWNGVAANYARTGNSDLSPVPQGVLPNAALRLDGTCQHVIRAPFPAGPCSSFQLQIGNSSGTAAVCDILVKSAVSTFGNRKN
jgi:hypothetical protein